MVSVLQNVAIDCANAYELARFWSAVTGRPMHPDDKPGDQEVERIMALGATFVVDHRNPDGTGWAVLTDPEGNEFCVLRSTSDRAATS
ncbi:hypothetical protein BBK82_40730 [Lentzea guizhouensis]|uniref:Glyoxalase-like domain-containing protein n=1 Tax=Lentzea guizhouensis TaxID=1586287 RepID=A0A1B2HUG7_9PSEU|nr:VOC family protein [Lentzea guizhouensis]ANZ41353.1 hypothetical protein BBK82_40730 [Lentzea guizhouensis]